MAFNRSFAKKEEEVIVFGPKSKIGVVHSHIMALYLRGEIDPSWIGNEGGAAIKLTGKDMQNSRSMNSRSAYWWWARVAMLRRNPWGGYFAKQRDVEKMVFGAFSHGPFVGASPFVRI